MLKAKEFALTGEQAATADVRSTLLPAELYALAVLSNVSSDKRSTEFAEAWEAISSVTVVSGEPEPDPLTRDEVWQLAVFRAARKAFLTSGSTATPQRLLATPEVQDAWSPKRGDFSTLLGWREDEWGTHFEVTSERVHLCLEAWHEHGCYDYGPSRLPAISIIATTLYHLDSYARRTFEKAGIDLHHLELSHGPAVIKRREDLRGHRPKGSATRPFDGLDPNMLAWTKDPALLAAVADQVELTDDNRFAIWVAHALAKIRAELGKPAASWEAVASLMSLSALVPDKALREFLSAQARSEVAKEADSGAPRKDALRGAITAIARKLGKGCSTAAVWAHIAEAGIVETGIDGCRFLQVCKNEKHMEHLYWGDETPPANRGPGERAFEKYMKETRAILRPRKKGTPAKT